MHPDAFFVDETSREALIRGSNFYGAVQVQIDSENPPVLDREFQVQVAGRILPSEDVTYENTENIRVVLPDGLAPGFYEVELTTPQGLSDRLDNALEIFEGSISIEDQAGGQGSEIQNHQMTPLDTLTLHCITRRQDDTFVRDEQCSWSLTDPIGDLDPSEGEQTVFSPTATGTTRVAATHHSMGSAQTGVIRVGCQEDQDCLDPCRSTSYCETNQCIQGPVDKDTDMDGYLDAACPDGDDCDDQDYYLHPDTPDWCDGIDNDCDPDTPDGSTDPWPQETCDGRDNDCDGVTDPENSLYCITYHLDADQDGFGDPGDSRCLCSPEGQYDATNGDDCDDSNASVHPEAHEGVIVDLQCNDGVDNDCDGETDSPDPCCGDDWWDTGWTNRRKLTFQNDNLSENLPDIPVLVKLDPGRIDYASVEAAGQDLRFVDADCSTLLDHQIEAWQDQGDSFLWIRVPRLARSGNPDHVWMYYNSPGAADVQNPGGVWNNDFEAVYHLHQDFDDSAVMGLHGTNQGCTDGPGVIGQGKVFDGASSRIDLGTDLDLLRETTGATLSVWFNPQEITTNILIALSVGSLEDTNTSRASMALEEPGNILAYGRAADYDDYQEARTGDDPVTTGSWYHLTAVFNYAYNRITLYLDGTEVASTKVRFGLPVTASTQTRNNSIGSQDNASGGFFSGSLDEVRIARSLRSAAWILAQHLSMTDGLLSFGAEEAP